MSSSLSIRIKKRTQSGWFLWLIILLPFLFGALNDLIGLPYALRYVLDIAWGLLLVSMLRNRHFFGDHIDRKLIVWVVLFVVYTLLVYLVQFQSPLYYIWGARNNFRFYVAFFACTGFMYGHDAEGYLEIFDKLFWINVVVSLIQFFAFDIEQDLLGGIFGASAGCNGYTNNFFLIVLTKSIVFYLDKRESTWACLSKCLAALLVAALAELKFFYVEFVVVIVLAVLFTRFTWRKFWLVIGGVASVVIGIALLINIFPNYTGWFTLERMLYTATSERGYTSSGDLNRLTAISSINELWLKTFPQRVFGLGLGNCDTSGFEFLNTPFFRNHGDMHYTWISYAIMYLECGWIGLIFYFGFFILVYFAIRKLERKSEGLVCAYCRFARILAVMWAVVSIYNSSLRAESGYMAYFALAVPFVMCRNQMNRNYAERVIKVERFQ